MGSLTETVQRGLSEVGFPLLRLLSTCFHEIPPPKTKTAPYLLSPLVGHTLKATAFVTFIH